MNKRIGIPREHPEARKARRERFRKVLKEARNVLKKELSEKEINLIKELISELVKNG